MDKIRIINQLKNTVGYNESDNRVEYLKGAGMALDKAIAEHEMVTKSMDARYSHLEDQAMRAKRVLSDFNVLLRLGEDD